MESNYLDIGQSEIIILTNLSIALFSYFILPSFPDPTFNILPKEIRSPYPEHLYVVFNKGPQCVSQLYTVWSVTDSFPCTPLLFRRSIRSHTSEYSNSSPLVSVFRIPLLHLNHFKSTNALINHFLNENLTLVGHSA